MRRALIVVCALACSDRTWETSSAIQGGTLEKNPVPVLAIMKCSGPCKFTPYLNAIGICSSVLVAPNLLITARHCVSPLSGQTNYVSCTETKLGPPANADEFVVTPAPSIYDGGPWINVTAVDVAPGGDSHCGYDVAILHLAKPYVGAPPATPRFSPLPMVGDPYDAIGYGAEDGMGNGTGARRVRRALKVACVSPSCGPKTPDLKPAIVDGEIVGETGTCTGDSGGPALDPQGMAFAVLSRGQIGQCAYPVYDGLSLHADWIRKHAYRAAAEGGYAVPDWAIDRSMQDASTPPEPEAGIPPFTPPAKDAGSPASGTAGGGCAVAPSRPMGLAALVLVLLLRERRKRGTLKKTP